MAITYVGGKAVGVLGRTTDLTISLADLSGGLDVTPSQGDFVVLCYGIGSNSARTPSVVTSGYTPLGQVNAVFASVTQSRFNVFYKRMGSTPDTEVVVSGTGSTNDGGAVSIHVLRGVDASTPLDVTSTSAIGSGTARANPPAITPSTSGALVLASGFSGNANAGGTYTSSDLSNFVTANADDNVNGSIGAGTFEWSSGSFDPAVFTYSGIDGSANSWAAYTLALRPATVVNLDGAASLAASGNLGASGLRIALGAGALVAAGMIAALGALGKPGAASLTASSDLDASAIVGSTFIGNATLQASGTLSSSGFATRAGGADLSNTGLMTANATREAVGAIDLIGSGSIIADPTLQSVGVSNLAAISALTAAGTRENLVEANLVATGGITASATRLAIGAAAFTGGGGTLTAGVTQRYGIAALFASSEANIAPSLMLQGDADLPAVGSALSVVKVTVQGGASLAGIGTVQAEGALAMFAAVSLSASSSMVALGVGGSEPIGAWYKKPEDGTWVETTPFVFTSDRRATEDGAIRVAESGQERGTTSDGWRAVYRAFVRVAGQWRKFYGEE